jgi:capsid protein
MVGFFRRLFGNPPAEEPWIYPEKEEPIARGTTISVDDLDPFPMSASLVGAPASWSIWDGGKYDGSYGDTKLLYSDYWTLRQRSSQLFTENLYARGLVRRLITNEINTGLNVEATPDESILGFADDSLTDWSENVENRFTLWAKNPELCDYEGRRTFGEIQQEARQEALVGGDVLMVLHQSTKTKLPLIQIIRGDLVQTPMMGTDPPKKNKIIDGVELDSKNRHVAYWVTQDDLSSKRILAKGSRSGRRKAWLVYGTDKRAGDVRGEPLLSLIIQSLKEVDRYRDAALRKATINSILAMFIEKTESQMGSLPVTGGAVRKGSSTVTDEQGQSRRYGIAEQIPGMVIEELQFGEKPTPHSVHGTDVNFGPFEESIIQAIAWACEIPPEILRLAFSNNYSASQAAINEFKIYLNRIRTHLGEAQNQPIYIEWLLSEVLLQKIDMPGFLEAWRDSSQYDVFAAWVSSDWSGAIKPSTDLIKQAKGYKLMVDEGWITNERTTREMTGQKFTKNMKRLKRENELKAEAMRPLLELQQEFGPAETAEAVEALENSVYEITAAADELGGVVNG